MAFNKTELLKNIEDSFDKAEMESLKTKVKGILQKKREAEKLVKSYELEIEKAIEEYENS